MKRKLSTLLISTMCFMFTLPSWSEEYEIDTPGMHAFIQFKISHLGYSWLLGRFNKFSGNFSYDPLKPNNSKVMVKIDTASIDSNHAERDKHLRSRDFLHVKKFPEAKFVSTGFEELDSTKAMLKGELTLKGVTRPLSIVVTHVGAGKDPWGGYRRGFEGVTKFRLKDFGIDRDLGASSQEVELYLSIEGVRKGAGEKGADNKTQNK